MVRLRQGMCNKLRDEDVPPASYHRRQGIVHSVKNRHRLFGTIVGFVMVQFMLTWYARL